MWWRPSLSVVLYLSPFLCLLFHDKLRRFLKVWSPSFKFGTSTHRCGYDFRSKKSKVKVTGLENGSVCLVSIISRHIAYFLASLRL